MARYAFPASKFCDQLTLTVTDKKCRAQWNGSERVNLQTLAESGVCLRSPRGSTYHRATPPAWPITFQCPTSPVRKLRRIQRQPRIGGHASTWGRRDKDVLNLRLRGAFVLSIRPVRVRRLPQIGGEFWPRWRLLLESSGRMWMTWCAKSSAGCIRARIVRARLIPIRWPASF